MNQELTPSNRLEALRRSRAGRMLLRLFASLSLLIVMLPSLLACYLGVASNWFLGVIELDSRAIKVIEFMESFIRSPSDIFQTFLAAFPPIAFCLSYAGRKNALLTPFGASLLAVLLIGVFLGVGLSISLNGGAKALPCTDSPACISWLASHCAESGRQCLTYFLLIIGFDRLTRGAS